MVDDPRLLLWVHCCEVDSFLSVARRGGLRLSDADADRYVAEQLRSARLIGIPDGQAPRTVAGLATYFDRIRSELRLTGAARSAARFVLAPPLPLPTRLAVPARPAWAGAAGLAFALQPPWARRLYGLPGLPSTDLAATLAVLGLRTALRTLPPRLREGPHYRRAKARMASTPVRRLEVV